MQKEPFDKNFPYKDNPAVVETFADGIHMVTAGGGTLRIDFTVSRADPPKGGNRSPTGAKVTAARLIMPLPCLADLYNQLYKIVRAMEQQGLLSRHADGVAQTLQ